MTEASAERKRILITGSATGIGKAIAVKLCSDGFDLALHYRSHEAEALALKSSLETSGAKITLLRADVRNAEETEAAIAADIDANGAYWGVVLNAGIADDGPFPGLKKNQWTSVIDTNLGGFFNTLQPCIMPMIRLRNGGRIVAISSIAGVIGNRGQSNYAASKAGIIAACKSLAMELGKRGITVNAVAPGIIATDMASDETIALHLERVPLLRAGKPEDVAAAVSFLLSDGAAYITRETINVNGGMI